MHMLLCRSVPVPEETLRGLEDAPSLWAYVKKQNYTAKERLMPQQVQAPKYGRANIWTAPPTRWP